MKERKQRDTREEKQKATLEKKARQGKGLFDFALRPARDRWRK
jgi:hypothetical protein